MTTYTADLPDVQNIETEPLPHLTNRVRAYLSRHPEVSPQQFIAAALEHEIASREKVGDLAPPPAPTAEDVRIHAWLTERIAGLDRERPNLWGRMYRYLFGDMDY